ncbi:MAG: NlpC/P60 family protein [Thermodesulfobacteriota bacterium]
MLSLPRHPGRHLVLLLALLLALPGCSALKPDQPDCDIASSSLAPMGHAIQVGAFRLQENAVRLTEQLNRQGLDAYHFREQGGLYKVRFGDFPTEKEARRRAERLRQTGAITDFLLIPPAAQGAARPFCREPNEMRRMLLRTAESMLGIPYQWGGESMESGFDCSGLTMTVYRLNGLRLPRHSVAQFEAGQPVHRRELRPGDLVFFATNGGDTVSHVGIYAGNDRFIHAPEQGKSIQYGSLASDYFESRFLGGRTYLAGG